MIKTTQEIESLLKNRPKIRTFWEYLTGIGFSNCLMGFIYPGSDCIDSLGEVFEGSLKQSSYWNPEEQYFCKGFYCMDCLFLVADGYSDGEDDWDEDELIVDRAVAQTVMTIILERVGAYYLNKLEE